MASDTIDFILISILMILFYVGWIFAFLVAHFDNTTKKMSMAHYLLITGPVALFWGFFTAFCVGPTYSLVFEIIIITIAITWGYFLVKKDMIEWVFDKINL